MWAGLEARDLENTWMYLENHTPSYSLPWMGASSSIKLGTPDTNDLEDSPALLIPKSALASLLFAEDNEPQGHLEFP